MLSSCLATNDIMYSPSYFRQIIYLTCVTSLYVISDRAAATIYTCTDSEGRQVFTDRGCPGKLIYQPAPNPIVKFTPLTTDELSRLQSLSRRTEETQHRRQKSKLQRARRLANLQSQRKQSCIEAVTALRTIATTRRKGYKLSAAQGLARSQASLEHKKRENC
jgi:hypothetical protein